MNPIDPDRAGDSFHLRATITDGSTVFLCAVGIAAGGHEYVYFGDRKGTIRAWDFAGQDFVRDWHLHHDDVLELRASTVDGQPVLVSTGRDGVSIAWELERRRELFRVDEAGSAAGTVVTLGGAPALVTTDVVAGHPHGQLRVLSLPTREVIVAIPTRERFLGLSELEARQVLITTEYAGDDRDRITTWDALTGEKRAESLLPSDLGRSNLGTASGRPVIMLFGDYGDIEVYDVVTGSPICRDTGPHDMERRWDGNTDGHWGVIADVDGEPALITIEHRQLRVRPITDPHAPGAVIGDSADRIYATWTNGSATNILTSTWEGRRMMVWRNRLSE